jgi:hypothetical protein
MGEAERGVKAIQRRSKMRSKIRTRIMRKRRRKIKTGMDQATGMATPSFS